MAKSEADGGRIRLDRFLAEMGAGSRSQIKEAARRGRVSVNGAVQRDAGRKVDPRTDTVAWDGKTVAYVKREYYMLNKPRGVVSAVRDPLCRTAVELIGQRRRSDLFPVGRLDIDTEGLLLITNDGELAHRLLSPGRHVDKTYLAEVEGRLPRDAARRFAEGLVLEDGTLTLPAHLEQAGEGPVPGGTGGPEAALSRQRFLLTIREGRYHQVKRMFAAVGCRVTYLKRLSMGSLRLDGALEPGAYRPLTEEEIEGLRASKERAPQAGAAEPQR